MGRYRFQDDDDNDDTAFYDSSSKDHNNSGLTEREEGEVIEDDESRRSDDYDYDRWKEIRRQEDEPNEEVKRRPSIASYISTFSSFSSFSGKKRHQSDSRSPSPDPSFREGRSRDWSDGDSYQHDGSDDTKEEYRLVGSTKYDRNYCKSDFYPSVIRGNDSNHSYMNSVSDDDDEYISSRNSNIIHPSNGALIKSSSRHNNPSNGNPEIHYHIYVSEKQASRWFPPGENVDPLSLSDGEGAGDEDHTQRQMKGMALWKKITVLAVLTQLLVLIAQRYDLVLLSPPPSYLTWEEYRSQQFRLVRKVSREGSSLLKHLATATYQQITRRNGLSKNEDERAASPRYEFPKSWESLAPPSSRGHTTEDCLAESCDRSSSANHRTVVFGQDVALEHMRNGLNHWSSSSYQRMHQQWARQKSWQHHRPPLVVYASGGKGVGKGSLAYVLLEQLKSNEAYTNTDGGAVASLALEECAAKYVLEQETSPSKYVSEEAPAREYYCPLLHLTPSSYHHPRKGSRGYPGDDDVYYADDYDGSENEMTESGSHFDVDSSLLLSPLYQKILDHVVAAGGGASIVVLDRVETFLDCENGEDVCDKVNGRAFAVGELVAGIRSQPEIFGNTIFVLTSQLGTSTLEKWTRKRLQSLRGEGDAASAVAVANAEAEALLKYELEQHHSGKRYSNGGDDDDAGDTTSMGIEDWLLVPMAPLDKTSMASLLDELAKSGPNPPFFDDESGRSNHGAAAALSKRPFLLTERASDRILDALEWHQWIHKTSGEILRIWSPEGARPLLKLWEERVLDPISSRSDCPQVTQSKVFDTASSEGKTTTTKTILVLDLDESSTDRLWLRLCKLAKDDAKEGPFVLVRDGRRWNCPGKHASSCVFYL